MFRWKRSVRHVARFGALIALALCVLSQLASPPQASPIGGQNRPASRKAAPLRDLSFKPDEVRDMGDTYYAMERLTHRVTARFSDGVVAVDRLNADAWSVEVQDRFGVYVGQLAVNSVGGGKYAVGYNSGQDHVSTNVESAVKPTADWAGLQGYMLWKDTSSRRGHGVERKGRFIRPRGAAAVDVEDMPIFLTSEFTDDISVTTHRRFRSVDHVLKTPAPYYVTTLTERGTTRGEMRWYPQTQTLEWTFPNLTSGHINPDALATIPEGGWTFRPTMAWANVQAYAFFVRHSKIQIEKRNAERSRPRSAFGRMADWLVPSLHAQNQVGCDYLHYLDNSVFAPCCDKHDQCYKTYGCDMTTWIVDAFANTGDWVCAGCNLKVMICFVTAGAIAPGESGGLPGMPSPGGGCTKWAGDYCEYWSDCCSQSCSENFCDGG